MKLQLSVISIILCLSINAQNAYVSQLNEDMTLDVKEVWVTEYYQSKTTFEQLPGFPMGFVANPSFKNMRNLTLHDLTGNGIPEIITAINDTLFVFNTDSMIWKRKITGTAVYPPSLADVTGDGYPDIVLTTGGVPAAGRVYLFDRNGNIVTGWPVNFSNNWMICAPALSDLNGDGKHEIVVCERIVPDGRVHILKHDGTSLNPGWPVTLNGIPAVTPSVGDVDGDGDKDIIVNSTNARYVFGTDGSIKPGYPLITEPGQKYSYQSPVLADLNNNNKLEIIGSSHGDAPKYYISDANGNNFPGWPVDVPDNDWTYSPPTVVKMNNQWQIFMSRSIGETADQMLFGWDSSGVMLPGLPIVKSGGLEGVICVADIHQDGVFDLVFGSNMLGVDGNGFIHAYATDGSGEIDGFPLRPKGWSFMNGVCFADVSGDGKLNLVALTYTNTFGMGIDSVFINVYDLQQSYSPQDVLWGTYKGSNTRTGNFEEIVNLHLPNNQLSMNNVYVYPSPANHQITVGLSKIDYKKICNIELFDVSGKKILEKNQSSTPVVLNIQHLMPGIYTIRLNCDSETTGIARFVKE